MEQVIHPDLFMITGKGNKMQNIFDTVINRKNTGSEKWDHCDRLFGGENLLPLWVADMDFRAPREVLDALAEKAAHGIFGYSTYMGSTYDSVISWFSRRHGWEIKKEWILYSPGVVPALNLLVKTFTGPYDGIIIQRPVYHPFMRVVEGNGRRLLNNPLRQNSSGEYEIDFEDLKEQARQPSAKMMILCSPHNPVGRVWNEDELREIIKICSANDIMLISDEIHCDLILNGHRHIPLSNLAGEFSNRIITCTAPSKTFNLAGLQVSNIIIPEEEKRKKFKKSLMMSSMMECNSFAPVAMEAAYNYGEKWLESLLIYIKGNFEFLKEFISKENINADVTDLQGTYLAWVDFRNYKLETGKLEDLFMKKAGVAPSPGHIFGHEGAGFMRFNLACPRSILEEGLTKMARAFRNPD